MNDLLQQTKKITYLFTDEEIINKINELDEEDKEPRRVALYLYKDRGVISEEDFTYEIVQYLYQYSNEPKEKIDDILSKNNKIIPSYYNMAVRGKHTYFHAMYMARHDLSGFFIMKHGEMLLK